MWKKSLTATTVLLAAITIVAPSIAQTVAKPVEGGFTFKRVGPPAKNTSKLINIRVEPKVAETPVLGHNLDLPDEKLPEDVRPLPKLALDGDWFWANVSPRLSDAGYGKLALAGRVLAASPDKAASIGPSTKQLRRIVDTFGGDILKATAGTQVSPALVVAVIATESAGRKDVVSSAGATGLMQLMPATAARFGVETLTDPAQNIAGGVKYLHFLLNHFDGDAVLAIAAYNAGEGAVARNGGVPEYKETRAYVPKVVAAWERARMMCLNPPSKATDGCVFTGLKLAAQ